MAVDCQSPTENGVVRFRENDSNIRQLLRMFECLPTVFLLRDAVLARWYMLYGLVSVCLCVCLCVSATSRSSTKMAKWTELIYGIEASFDRSCIVL